MIRPLRSQPHTRIIPAPPLSSSKPRAAPKRFTLSFPLPIVFYLRARISLEPAVFLPPAVERLHCNLSFLAGLWGGFSVRDGGFDLPQHRHDLLWFVPLDWHDPLFLQVDSLSFHLVQKSPVTSRPFRDSVGVSKPIQEHRRL